MSFYSPEGKYLWDAIIYKVRNTYHLFYLQADKGIDISKRDEHPVIGHAISRDLMTWKILKDALVPSKTGWDDLAIWSGNIIKKDDFYYYFYTAVSKEDPIYQRIGLATSKDLLSWKKQKNNPVLKIDEKLYSSDLKRNIFGSPPAWRDPYPFKDKKNGKYFMTFSARTHEKLHNACIGLAESDDLLNWKLKKPIIAPGIFDEMETSQVIFYDNLYYIFFSVTSKVRDGLNSNKNDLQGGLYCYYGKNLYDLKPVNENGLVLNYSKYLFSVQLIKNAKTIKNKRKIFLAIGWLNYDDYDDFVGKLSQIYVIRIDGKRVVCTTKEVNILVKDEDTEEQ